jgi:hypothetical protein
LNAIPQRKPLAPSREHPLQQSRGDDTKMQPAASTNAPARSTPPRHHGGSEKLGSVALHWIPASCFLGWFSFCSVNCFDFESELLLSSFFALLPNLQKQNEQLPISTGEREVVQGDHSSSP